VVLMAGRPDPDELLAQVRAEEESAGRGRLKIFFGACAGVGKTYAMLEAAHALRGQGVDVVAGWVETHGRAETEALLHGLERLQARQLSYRGVELAELDIDAAVERRPTLLLVDELAHSNAPGSRHAKRWMDVVELLDAGISVYTTLNVQHVESLNDVVAQITGIAVRETVPDHVVDEADEIALVDLPPRDLLDRLGAGKVYTGELAGVAAHSFFREGNLIALRELALRRTAERVDAQMQRYRREHAISEVWPATETLLVLVAASPYAARLVRATRRIAARSRASWIALHVETPGDRRLPQADRTQLARALALAERLGGEVVTIAGDDVVDEAVAYASTRNVTRIVVGKPAETGWRDRWRGSLADRVIRASGGIDVLVLAGRVEATAGSLLAREGQSGGWLGYLWAAAAVIACTVVAHLMRGSFGEADIIMLYLVGVMVIATRWRRRHAVAASLLSVGAFDFFFVLPYHTFAIEDARYLVTFAVMLAAALVISGMASRVRDQVEAGRTRERRTAALYAMASELARCSEERDVALAVVHHVGASLETPVTLQLVDAAGDLVEVAGSGAVPTDERERSVARWGFEHRQMAGRWTDTLPGGRLLWMPLLAARDAVGVLGLDFAAAPTQEQGHLLEALSNQAALAVERLRLVAAAREAELTIEAERFRSTLLSAVSHDLRTPLASIAGSASGLLDPALTAEQRRELAEGVVDETRRLNRLIADVLQATRLESGAVRIEKEWQPLEEALGAAISRLESELELGRRAVTVTLAPDLPMVPADGLLLEQLFRNLLENAVKYTPEGTPITVRAWPEPGRVEVEVADHGPGLPPGSEERVFERFVQLGDGVRGVGLGLTICRGIVMAHGGTIWAENRREGGVAFRFRLPVEGHPPVVELDAPAGSSDDQR
jgi:two-component system sensor histidine kinase KdpD